MGRQAEWGIYPMMAGTRIFVIFVFAVIGVAFLSMPAVLIFEFGGANPLELGADWLAIATLYSHHFLFFPVLGIFTLAAFYIPACVFVDMYWRVVRFGRARFFIGALVLAGLSYQSRRLAAGWRPCPMAVHAGGAATGPGIAGNLRPLSGASSFSLHELQRRAETAADRLPQPPALADIVARPA